MATMLHFFSEKSLVERHLSCLLSLFHVHLSRIENDRVSVEQFIHFNLSNKQHDITSDSLHCSFCSTFECILVSFVEQRILFAYVVLTNCEFDLLLHFFNSKNENHVLLVSFLRIPDFSW